jgi:hypothetical protein
MGDTMTCPGCGETVDSVEQLETTHEAPEIEENDDGSITLFGNNDLFLCKNCKNPLGVRR